MSMGDIASSLGQPQSRVSRHLRRLRSAGLLWGERRGRQVIHGAADEYVRSVVADLAAHVLELREAPPEIE